MNLNDYKQKTSDLSKFYIPSPEAFPWIISYRVQGVEQWDLEFRGGRFGYTGITWDMMSKWENGHGPQTFSTLQGQIQHMSLTLVTTPSVCTGTVPGVHALNTAEAGASLPCSPNPCAWIIFEESQGGEKAGRRAAGHLLIVPIWGWETARAHTSLRSSEVIF